MEERGVRRLVCFPRPFTRTAHLGLQTSTQWQVGQVGLKKDLLLHLVSGMTQEVVALVASLG